MEHNTKVLFSKLWNIICSLSSVLLLFCLFKSYTEITFSRSYRGKPRRFSDNFLVVERKQLEDYRKEVRTRYGQLSDGSLDYLPADVARPFSIGQQVIVRHPSSRELCDGKVVMVDQDSCKVQFDNHELGLDLVQVHFCYFACFQHHQYACLFVQKNRHLTISSVESSVLPTGCRITLLLSGPFLSK